MWPSMVTHTRNLCSAFNPSKVHTHSSVHTPGAVGSHIAAVHRELLGIRCLDQGSHPSVVVLRVEESAGYSLPPPTIPGSETRTPNLRVLSQTLYPLGHD